MSVEYHGDHETHKVEVNLASLTFGGITRFNTVVYVCHYLFYMLILGEITLKLIKVWHQCKSVCTQCDNLVKIICLLLAMRIMS